MKLFSDYLRGCQVIFLKGLVGHEPFFEFYKIASTPPPPPTHPLHILNDRCLISLSTIITIDNWCLLSLQIDHLIDNFYTNLAESEAKSHILETFLLKQYVH